LVRSLLSQEGMAKTWRRHRGWILTAAVVVVPFAGVLLAVYGVGRLVMSRRPKPGYDPYQEWLSLRDLMRSRRTETNGVASTTSASPTRPTSPRR
jgi:hypothetical protein